MKISKVLSAVAASAMLLGLAIPASAAGLMNVTTSGTTSLSGTINSHTTSWDEYAGAQITVSETSSKAGAIGADLTGLAPSSGLGGNLNLYAQKSENFAAQANITFFKGGDTSDTTVNGHINQVQTTFSTGVTTSFGN
jgi:hypothetical protein